MEPLGIDIGMAQGLLVTKDGLYVDVNGGDKAGLYRFQDTDNDGSYEKKEHIIPLNGGGEHGPHAVLEGRTGDCISQLVTKRNCHSESMRREFPVTGARTICSAACRMHVEFMAGVPAPGGFVLSFNPDGSDIEIVATGFRNQYDIDFSPTGELFTYDADMEWDVGTPWYRPTRVNHVISGASSVGEMVLASGRSISQTVSVRSLTSDTVHTTGISFGTELNSLRNIRTHF